MTKATTNQTQKAAKANFSIAVHDAMKIVSAKFINKMLPMMITAIVMGFIAGPS